MTDTTGRKRKQRPVADFTAVVDTASTLNRILLCMANVIDDVPIRFNADKSISITRMDANKMCMVIARIKLASLTGDLPRSPLLCDLGLLYYHTKRVKDTHTLELSGAEGNPDLRLSVRRGDHFFVANLRTKEEEPAPKMRLPKLKYDYAIPFPANTLREIVLGASKSGCKYVRFRVLETKRPEDGRYLVVTIYGQQSDVEHRFHSSIAQGDGVMQRSAKSAREPTVEELLVRVNCVFSSSYLAVIMKNLSNTKVYLKLADGKPLQIKFRLGDDASHLTFVLAPQEDDCDLPQELISFRERGEGQTSGGPGRQEGTEADNKCTRGMKREKRNKKKNQHTQLTT